MKKLLAAVASIAMLGVLATGCSGNTSNSSSTGSGSASSAVSGSVTAAGSSALVPLVKAAAKNFMDKNPDATITVNAGGSGNGLKQIGDKAIDIGNSDIPPAGKIDDAKAKLLVDHQVAIMPVAVIINSKVTGVKNLTTQQLVDIFTGKTTNWKDAGGPDLPITLVTRPDGSGTRATFKQYGLNGAEEAHSKSLETDDSGTLVQNVQNNNGGIGYVALSYLVTGPSVSTVSIDGTAPTLANVYSNKYKVWNVEHMFTNGQPTGATKAFLDYIASKDFAPYIETLGYGDISKMQTTSH